MRKIVAFAVCSVLAFSLGYSILPESFNLLIGWLGPVFGTSLHVLFSMVFVLLGDPLKFMMLLYMWIAVGFICGLIVRKRLASLSAAFLVCFAMFLVIIVAGLRIFEIVMGLGIMTDPGRILTMLPPLPPSATLSMVLNAPVVNEIYSAVQGISLTTMPSPMEIILPFLSSIVPNFVKNIAILLVSSLIGCEIGKLIGKIGRKKKPETPESTSSKTETNSGVTKRTPMKVRKITGSLSSIFLLAIIFSASILSAASMTKNLESSSYYAEGIFGFATPDGTAYMASAFLDSEMSFTGIDFSSSEFSGALMGVLVSHDTSAARLPPILTSPEILLEALPPEARSQIPSELLQNLTRYYEIVPKTVFLIVYFDVNPTVARQRADTAASKFSSSFGATLSFLAAFSQDGIMIGNVAHSVTFLAYQSMATLSEVAGNIIRALPTQRGGLATVINSVYQSRILTPGATSDSANGTIMTAGFFSSTIILSLLESMGPGPQDLVRLILPNTTTPTPTLGIFSYWLNWLHSSSFAKTFSVNDLLKYKEPIRFSPQATISVVATVVPNATIEEGKIVSQKAIISVVTSANLTKPEFELVRAAIQSLKETAPVTVTQTSPGETLKAEDLTVSFTQVFPLNLRMEKVVSFSEVDIGQMVTVTIRIVNDDDSPAENVKLNDRQILGYYGPGAIRVEGDLTRSWPSIPAKSTTTHSYSIILKKEGIYTLPSAELTYKYVDTSFTAKSNFAYVKVRSPSVFTIIISGVPAAWGILERTINMVPGLQGKGSLVLTAVSLIIIVSLAVVEYLNFRKWRKARKQTQ